MVQKLHLGPFEEIKKGKKAPDLCKKGIQLSTSHGLSQLNVFQVSMLQPFKALLKGITPNFSR